MQFIFAIIPNAMSETRARKKKRRLLTENSMREKNTASMWREKKITLKISSIAFGKRLLLLLLSTLSTVFAALFIRTQNVRFQQHSAEMVA